jgi:hypothetical protein
MPIDRRGLGWEDRQVTRAQKGGLLVWATVSVSGRKI